MPNVRAILYDAGRTLLRPRPQAADIWDFLSKQLGVDVAGLGEFPDVGHFFYTRLGEDGMGAYDSDARARSFWSAYYVHAMEDARIDRKRDELIAAADAVYTWYQHPEQWETYVDVADALHRAREAGLVQGVVSDWGTELISLLHAHEVTQYLDFVVASASVGLAKPHAEIFTYALARADLDPSDVVYVGDSYVSDVLGARTAGIRGVLLDREGTAPAVDCPVVRDLHELLDLVEA